MVKGSRKKVPPQVTIYRVTWPIVEELFFAASLTSTVYIGKSEISSTFLIVRHKICLPSTMNFVRFHSFANVQFPAGLRRSGGSAGYE